MRGGGWSGVGAPILGEFPVARRRTVSQDTGYILRRALEGRPPRAEESGSCKAAKFSVFLLVKFFTSSYDPVRFSIHPWPISFLAGRIRCR
jgi:hypothetical protein